MRQVIALFDEYQSRANAKHVLRAMKKTRVWASKTVRPFRSAIAPRRPKGVVGVKHTVTWLNERGYRTRRGTRFRVSDTPYHPDESRLYRSRGL